MPSTGRVPRVHRGAGEKPQGWQKGLDKAFLDVDASPTERFEGLRDFLSNPLQVATSLREAVQVMADKGLKEGQSDALDALFPSGTLARSDLEGLLAVARQAPEVIADLRGNKVVSTTAPPSVDQVKDAVGRLLSPEGLAEAADGARNALRSTPKGLEEPAFEVVRSGKGYEIRQYEAFTVATRRMPLVAPNGITMPEPFNSLVTYLLGDKDNRSDFNMTMTMPVEMRYNDSDPDEQTMSFHLPKNASLPVDPSLQLVEVPERLLAVRCFPGIATAGEVSREYERLLQALAFNGTYEPAEEGAYSVLQFNPPYTIPWRRRNEVAVEVFAKEPSAEMDEDAYD